MKNLIKKINFFSEYKTLFFTVTIIVIVVFTGVVLYNHLTNISKKVSNSLKTSSPASIISKQIVLELGSAENNVRAYHLTKDLTYIQAFYEVGPDLENQISVLKKLPYKNRKEIVLIDSIIGLSKQKLALIKMQSFLEDPVNVTNKLNLISKKIDETYYKQKELNKPTEFQKTHDTLLKKKGFLNRLFGKKKTITRVDTFQQTATKIKTDSINLKSKNQLKNAVLQVKSSQIQELAKYKQNEYQLAKESQWIMERINYFTDELKRNEDAESIAESNLMKNEVNKITQYSILFSVIISFSLLMLIYLIKNYINSKNKYELALLESKQNAEDLVKTKEAFLANMSHEIKTPLNAIYGFTEQILSSELNPEQAQQLNIVKNSAAYLTKLVNNILIYAKLQSGKSQIEISNFNIKKELKDIEELFKIQAKSKGINLIFDIQFVTVFDIESDINKLKQILFNLIGNAIKFTNKGAVKIIAKTINEKEHNYLEIIISDTGIGIAEDKLPKLFNEFEQGDDKIFKKYGGTGLGLFITKQIIEQLNGKIKITSKVKVGTTVAISIPVKLHQTDQSTITEKINYQLEGNTLTDKTILVADDEEFNRFLIKTILKKYNTIVFEAINGIEAVEKTRNQHFDLIVMDVRMPEMNGIDATLIIRTFNKYIPILASTAVMDEQKIAKCMQAGMNSFVFKPFTEKELIIKIISALNGIDSNKKVEINNFLENDTITKNKCINVNSLNDYANGDENFKKEMIHIFHKSINNALLTIEKIAVDKNYNEISEIAHKIIPSCKHFEAHNLYTVLKYLESIKNKSTVNHTEFNKNIINFREQIVIINKELELHL